MSIRHCVAVDLGASSGRVMLASYQPGPRALTLREIHRFTNSLQKVDGFDCWDVDSLESEIRRGLEKVCEQGILIDSIGIDTWGVDYVLLDKQGQRVGLPISYRDDRTQGLCARWRYADLAYKRPRPTRCAPAGPLTWPTNIPVPETTSGTDGNKRSPAGHVWSRRPACRRSGRVRPCGHRPVAPGRSSPACHRFAGNPLTWCRPALSNAAGPA